MQTLRQRDCYPYTPGEKSKRYETGDGTDDHHILVLAFGVPTDHLTVRLHGAQPIGVHIALERLNNCGGHRDDHRHEHGAHGSEQCRREVSDANTSELREVEHHHMQEVHGNHAKNENDESERIGDISVQRWCCHDTTDIQDLQPEVQQRRRLDDRREWLRPSHRQHVHHAKHLEKGEELAADDGHERERAHLPTPALARDEAVHAPENCQSDNDGADQKTHIRTTAGLSMRTRTRTTIETVPFLQNRHSSTTARWIPRGTTNNLCVTEVMFR